MRIGERRGNGFLSRGCRRKRCHLRWKNWGDGRFGRCSFMVFSSLRGALQRDIEGVVFSGFPATTGISLRIAMLWKTLHCEKWNVFSKEVKPMGKEERCTEVS